MYETKINSWTGLSFAGFGFSWFQLSLACSAGVFNERALNNKQTDGEQILIIKSYL